MRFNTRFFAMVAIALSLGATSSEAQKRTRKPPPKKPTAPVATSAPPISPSPVPMVVDERQIYLNAARTAWAFVDRNYQPSTGLALGHDTYQFVTVWDIASTLAATYSAHELGLVSDPIYNQRMQRVLTTLSTMPLYDGVAFNKFYDARTGRMVDRRQQPSSKGYGWSITDIGRLLTWLRIIAVNQPQFASQATAVVQRLNMPRLITADGYLQGHDLDPRTGQPRSYPEGRMGYEQYAAAGLALWGHRAEKALDARVNAAPANVFGVAIVADRRGNDRITSEPYIMMGMETGWYSPELREQAWRVLAAQEARYKSTGTMTMVSEDALPDPPYYFYYYSLYRDGQPFVVDAHSTLAEVNGPRWVSSKAAFAWHALLPTPYTLAALQAVQSSAIPGKGWGAGVYEISLRPTGNTSLNGSALILEAAVYNLRGHPFLATKL
jgi:hypothetical protein